VAGRRDGPPLLALQGLGADHRGWIAQRRALGARYRLILVDNRGVGGSGRPPGPYDLEVMAADAVAVLDAEGLDDAHVIGASMGGVLAQILATRHASRVRSITLACTACRHHTWRRELLAQWREVAVTEGMAALAPVAARWLVGPRTLRRVRSALDLVAPLALNVAPGPFAAQVDAILALDDDLRFELASVRVPTLVLTGTQDLLTPFGDAEEIAELVPGARLAALRGAAHGFMVEQAGTFNRTVVDFLDEVVARGPHLAASA
jgi:pimeloyl-ACP methyl ester carboxylesterase